jgi:hypothetical protein
MLRNGRSRPADASGASIDRAANPQADGEVAPDGSVDSTDEKSEVLGSVDALGIDAPWDRQDAPIMTVDAPSDELVESSDGALRDAVDVGGDLSDASISATDGSDAPATVQVSSPCKSADECSGIGGGYLCLTVLSMEGLNYPSGYCTRACDLGSEANGCRGLAETNCFATGEGYYCFKQCNPNSPMCEPGLSCKGVYNPTTSTYGPPFLCY